MVKNTSETEGLKTRSSVLEKITILMPSAINWLLIKEPIETSNHHLLNSKPNFYNLRKVIQNNLAHQNFSKNKYESQPNNVPKVFIQTSLEI